MTVQHVSLETRPDHAEAEVAFWALLGFEPVQPPDTLRDRASWVQRRGTQVHILYAQDPTVMPRGHVAVVVDDYAATLDRLRAAGHAAEPRRPHWGASRAYVRTPAGHLVELMAAPPPA